jgi:hypothetical protein
MFDKKYVLECLFPIICFDVTNKEKRIQYWVENFKNSIWKDIETIIQVTREIIRDKDRIVKNFKEREKKIENI